MFGMIVVGIKVGLGIAALWGARKAYLKTKPVLKQGMEVVQAQVAIVQAKITHDLAPVAIEGLKGAIKQGRHGISEMLKACGLSRNDWNQLKSGLDDAEPGKSIGG